jgi:ABC-type enterobactin transport system permease subunit
MVLKALSADAAATLAGTLTIWAPITSLNRQPKPLAVPYIFTISSGAFSGVLWQIKRLASST